MKIFAFSLLVVVVVVTVVMMPSTNAFSIATPTRSRSARISSSSSTSSTTSLYGEASSSTAEAREDAKALLERTAKLRAEIAELQGKTVEEVEQEARNEKQQMEEAVRRSKEEMQASTIDQGRVYIDVPTTVPEMLVQARNAIERAYLDGNRTRQTVRLALLREEEMIDSENQWPGGAQQMYREAAKPLTMSLLKDIRTSRETASFLPPNVTDQDIWDFDGSGLITATSASSPTHDVQAMVLPNTDTKYLDDIATIDKAMGPDRLFLLVNPFWRNLNSWGFNILAPKAKNKAKSVLFDNKNGGYEETYVLLRFSVRGESCIAIKSYPYDWQLFATLEDEDNSNYGYTRYIRLGSCKEEPKTELVTKLLNEREEFKMTKTMRQLKKRL